MKIGVISDTHLHQMTPELAEVMKGPFKDVEMVLHAGDLTELEILKAFPGVELLAVCGNMDSPAVRKQLPARRVFQAGRFTIGLVHGWGGPRGIEERIAREFEGTDCIVYGHTHTSSCRRREGLLFFNPGAFGAGAFAAGSNSVGVLDAGETLSGQIFHL